jgi:hypothetical protein
MSSARRSRSTASAMGTFHHDKGELHGITVVVHTTGPRTYVGRCDVADERAVVLLDADVHEAGTGPTREEYLRSAARFGVWAKHRRIEVPRAEVADIVRLGEIALD